MPEPKENKDDRITVVFPAAVGRELRAIADETLTPVSILIRQWVMERLRQMRRQQNEDAP